MWVWVKELCISFIPLAGIKCSKRKQLRGERGVLSSLFLVTAHHAGKSQREELGQLHVIVTVRSRKALTHQCCLLTWRLASIPYSFVVQSLLPWEYLDAHWTFKVKTSVDVPTDQLDLDNSSVDGGFWGDSRLWQVDFKINDCKLLKAFYGKLYVCGEKSGGWRRRGRKEEVCIMRSRKYYVTE